MVLYDRKNDPEELNNLVDKKNFAAVQKKLKHELRTWLEHWDDADPVETERGFIGKH